MGVATLVGGYLPWWGGTYPGGGVPTLVGSTYPGGGVPTLVGGTYPGGGYLPCWGYLPCGGTYPGGGYLPCALLVGTFQGDTYLPASPPSTRVGTTQSTVGTSSWGRYLGQGSCPPGQAKYPSLTHLMTWGPLPYSTSNHGGTSVPGIDTLVLGYPHHTHNQVYPSPQLDPRRPPQA